FKIRIALTIEPIGSQMFNYVGRDYEVQTVLFDFGVCLGIDAATESYFSSLKIVLERSLFANIPIKHLGGIGKREGACACAHLDALSANQSRGHVRSSFQYCRGLVG